MRRRGLTRRREWREGWNSGGGWRIVRDGLLEGERMIYGSEIVLLGWCTICIPARRVQLPESFGAFYALPSRKIDWFAPSFPPSVLSLPATFEYTVVAAIS